MVGGVGAANLDGRTEPVPDGAGQVAAGGDAEVLAALEAGEDAGCAPKAESCRRWMAVGDALRRRGCAPRRCRQQQRQRLQSLNRFIGWAPWFRCLRRLGCERYSSSHLEMLLGRKKCLCCGQAGPKKGSQRRAGHGAESRADHRFTGARGRTQDAMANSGRAWGCAPGTGAGASRGRRAGRSLAASSAGDLLRGEAPADGAEVLAELLLIARADDERSRRWGGAAAS